VPGITFFGFKTLERTFAMTVDRIEEITLWLGSVTSTLLIDALPKVNSGSAKVRLTCFGRRAIDDLATGLDRTRTV